MMSNEDDEQLVTAIKSGRLGSDGAASPALTQSFSAYQRIESLFNLLRLPINWSGLEPAEGQFEEDYLLRVDQVIDWCAEFGIYVLVDFHQDAYSKEIGEDGAPLWAIVPPPTELLEGPMHDLTDRRQYKLGD